MRLPLRAARTREKNLWVLPLLFAMAVGLTILMPGQAVSRGLFQSPQNTAPEAFDSPLNSPIPTPLRAPGGFLSPLRSPTPGGSNAPPASPMPRSSPTPGSPMPSPTATLVPAQAKTATAVAQAFLPPPTLAAANTESSVLLLPAGRTSPNDPLAAVSRSADVPSADPGAQAGRSVLTSLADAAALFGSYGWLACGILEVAAAAVAIAWYWRRKT